jgi:autotransporter strand-loop-strand O-heptosyltransferase
MLWKFISQNSEKSLSAGRCQTPALRLVYDNQKEIDGADNKKVFNTIGYFTNMNLPFELNNQFEKEEDVIEFLDKTADHNHIYNCSQPSKVYKQSPEPFTTSRLQQAASNILALEYEEIHPRIAFDPGERPVVNEYVCISTRSTAQCKHWYYWKELIAALKTKGYRVFELSQEADDLGAETLEDKSLQNAMRYLYHADHYIGLSSGISWLNWAVGKHTIMISNFTEAGHEFVSNCTRIINPNVCNSCWNNPLFKFNKGDWNWCPEHEDTPRHFECHKSIKVESILNLIK